MLMKEKNLIIICLTAIICVMIICGTLILTSSHPKTLRNNITINNTTDNNTTNIGLSVKKTTYESTNTQSENSGNSKKQSTSSSTKKKDTVNGGAKDIGGDYYQTPDGKVHYGAKYYDHPGDDSDYD